MTSTLALIPLITADAAAEVRFIARANSPAFTVAATGVDFAVRFRAGFFAVVFFAGAFWAVVFFGAAFLAGAFFFVVVVAIWSFLRWPEVLSVGL
ncbi:MAG: hypothetical protein AAFZ07_16530 [Actinomycetota bacterium]